MGSIISPDQGQALETSDNGQALETSDNGQVKKESQWYAWTDPESKKTYSFTSPDDVTKFLNDSYHRDRDYTQKTQAVAEERKQITLMRQQLENDRQAYLESVERSKPHIEKIKAYQEFVKTNPSVIQELEKRMNHFNPGDIESRLEALVEKKYGSKLKKFESWQARQEAERQKDEAFKILSQKYPDANPEQIMGLFNELTTADGFLPLAEMLYFANKGKMTPKQIEERITAGQEKKKQAGLLNGGGSPQVKQKFNSIDEIMEWQMEH